VVSAQPDTRAASAWDNPSYTVSTTAARHAGSSRWSAACTRRARSTSGAGSGAVARLSPVQRPVHGEPVQPRPEGGLAPELVQPPPRLHEDLLRHVVAVLGRAGEPAGKRAEAELMAHDQFGERVGIAVPAAGHEGLVSVGDGHARAFCAF
jgi:hypothetical protein